MIVGGLALFVGWFEYFVIVFKALLPLAVIAVGGVLAYFGWEERMDRKTAFLDFSSPDEANRYQAEALAYQEKLNGLHDASEPASALSGSQDAESAAALAPGAETSLEAPARDDA
jgi:hypothetical protein